LKKKLDRDTNWVVKTKEVKTGGKKRKMLEEKRRSLTHELVTSGHSF